jgi:hypothetical protein
MTPIGGILAGRRETGDVVGTRRRTGRSFAAAAGALAMTAVLVAPSEARTPARATTVAIASAAAEPGFRVETRTTYAFDPRAEVVHVAFDATLTNQKPSQSSGGYVTSYFLPKYGLPVLSEAVDLRATEGGAVLHVQLEDSESPRFKFAVIDLQPDLQYGMTQQVHLTYDLPKVPPRSDGFTRLNTAYATFPLLAIGDPDLTSVEVLVPNGWEVEVVGDSMDESEREGHQVFAAEKIADPDAWEARISARDDSKLIERSVDVGEHGVDLLGWPDDEEWVDFAEEQVREGVPALEELIGIEWPADETIDVVETASPYLYGYAGWYMPYESVIEVGDELDEQVMLHELSHLWFNDDLFRGRWINEAFAEALSAVAIEELGGDELAPKPIERDDPGRLKLNEWSNPDLQDGRSDDQERFGYNASWAVMDAIVDEIGIEALAEVIRAADVGHVAYRGPGVPEETARTFQWQELLDLLEDVGGSEKAAGLFERHVVAPAEVELFELRAGVRERYAELVEAGDGWQAPAGIRLAMAGWRFAAAEDLMDEADAILDQKAELLELTADLDVADRLALEDTYEEGKDLEDVAQTADEAIRTAAVLGDAEDAVADGAGPVGALGLVLDGAGDELDDAHQAFDAGDYEAARAAAADAEDVIDGAVATALTRLLGLVVLVAAAVLILRTWRRHRARRAEKAAAAEQARAEVEAATWGPPEPVPAGPVAAGPSEADGAEGVGGPVDGGGEVRVRRLEP